MSFELREYNVVLDESDSFSIQLVNDYLLYNNEKISDVNKINEIKNMLIQYKNEILKLGNEGVNSYKGGRQKYIKIQYEDGDNLEVIGNTPSDEMANLYYELRNKLVSIIEK